MSACGENRLQEECLIPEEGGEFQDLKFDELCSKCILVFYYVSCIKCHFVLSVNLFWVYDLLKHFFFYVSVLVQCRGKKIF